MNQAKYIVYEDRVGMEVPIIFDNVIGHDVVACNFNVVNKVVGAGFVRFDEGGATCGGESTSLGIGSRKEEDSELINWRILRKGFEW